MGCIRSSLGPPSLLYSCIHAHWGSLGAMNFYFFHLPTSIVCSVVRTVFVGNSKFSNSSYSWFLSPIFVLSTSFHQRSLSRSPFPFSCFSYLKRTAYVVHTWSLFPTVPCSHSAPFVRAYPKRNETRLELGCILSRTLEKKTFRSYERTGKENMCQRTTLEETTLFPTVDS